MSNRHPAGRLPIIEGFRQSVIEQGVLKIGDSGHRVRLNEKTLDTFTVSAHVGDEFLEIGFLQRSDGSYAATTSSYTNLGSYASARRAVKTLLRKQLQLKKTSCDLDHAPKEIARRARKKIHRIESGDTHPMEIGGSKMQWNGSIYGVPVGQSWRIVFEETEDGFLAQQILSHEDYNKYRNKHQS